MYFIAKYLQSELEIHDFILATKDKNSEELEAFLKTIGIEISFKNCKKKSLYEAVEILIATFLNDKVNTSYLQYFLDLVLEKMLKCNRVLPISWNIGIKLAIKKVFHRQKAPMPSDS